jgi:tetratricopeptide (TPR) repeat protein
MSARAVLLASLLFGVPPFAVPGYGQKHFDFNSNCRQAYQEIIQLRLDEGSRLLAAEKKRDPNNLIPIFLDNYIDFFQLFFNEDPADYQARKGMLDRRIESMSEGPESSPFSLFTRSVIHFQWAAIKIKFGNNWDAGWQFRRSFLESKECGKKFPSFEPATMLSGAMQVVAGTIPDGYKWLSSLLGIRGSVNGGMRQLNQFLTSEDPMAELYRDETVFYYLYLQFYIQNKREDVFTYIRQHRLDVRNNYLYAYLYANLCINDQQSALAEQIISQKSNAPGYLDMPVWDLEMGYASLNHLEPGTPVYLERFLRRFKGRFYVKDALSKLSWYYYLKGDAAKADSLRGLVLKRGQAESDADRQALKEARSGKWPDKILLQSRLLSDGGYFEEALRSLQGVSSSSFVQPEDKCELAYRLGRIYDGLGRGDEAIVAYLTTIKTGEQLPAYYAARAALQAGYIYEGRGEKDKAIAFFQKCLSLKDHDYKNSLDQRAKAGIARCKGE